MVHRKYLHSDLDIELEGQLSASTALHEHWGTGANFPMPTSLRQLPFWLQLWAALPRDAMSRVMCIYTAFRLRIDYTRLGLVSVMANLNMW